MIITDILTTIYVTDMKPFIPLTIRKVLTHIFRALLTFSIHGVVILYW